MKQNHLDIILRTCKQPEGDLRAKLHPESQLERVCGDDREVMLVKCVTSLIKTINGASFDIKLTVLDDHSTPEFLALLGILVEKCKHPHEIVSLEERGFNSSAYQQFYLASQGKDLVYSVEDDYLHESTAIISMLNAYKYFSGRIDLPVLIHPFDCPLRYDPGKEALTRLYYDGTRYWRNVTHTTNTFLTAAKTLRDNFGPFKRLALEYPRVLEADTINSLYYDEEMKQGVIAAFNPIPSCAYHLSFTPHASIRTTHAAWEHIWAATDTWQLIDGWFNYENFYRNAVPRLQPGAKVVEVGAWLGKSSACLTMLCRAKGIKPFIVDTWEGSTGPGEEIQQQIIDDLARRGVTLFDQFQANMKMCGLENQYINIRALSNAASIFFEDGTVDLVVLDASHDYESVITDIDCWLPKVKKGGIIAGDDYDPAWEGVKRAVNERFPDVSVMGSTWVKVV